MFPIEKKDKEGGPATRGSLIPSNSSSESERRRERIEGYKEARRRELSAKNGWKQDTTVKSFKTTRKKDVRGEGREGSGKSQPKAEEQVEARRYLRREGNKTESTGGSGNNGETGHTIPETGNAISSREGVVVRETKASRLRAASRTPTSDLETKSVGDARKTSKEMSPSSGSPTHAWLNRKSVDKSHSRKSHLNRSHTCEGVYDDVYSPGGSNVRRRGVKTLSLESSPVKTITEKVTPCFGTMGNSNGSIKESQQSPEPSFRVSQFSRSPFNSFRKSSSSLSPVKKRIEPEAQGSKYTRPSARTSPEHAQKRLSSSEEKDVLDNNNKLKQVDIATRAEILAASTLKMINRLDEINSKSKRLQGNAGRVEEASKKALPFTSVISSNLKHNSFSETNAGSHQKPEVKKVPASDDTTAKSSSLNRRNVRHKPDAITKIETGKKTTKTEIKVDSGGKVSILKNKPTASTSPAGVDAQKSKPVSILKRKSLSQDESPSPPPPVTFSPSVLKKETNPKRQGILKKRRSLDESEVSRRRSYSPDANDSDFKSILKNQRRSSMEELTRRSHSPDLSTPQGILKRKSSKEEEVEDVTVGTSVEPQGILKRKLLPCFTSPREQHIKITDGVILATAAGIGEMQVTENVRPILKKKSSSEEHSASEVSLTEVPKSILKKKISLDAEEGEEKPKKPILKSSRMSSLEEPDEVKRTRSVSDVESVKPILKRENSKFEDEDGSCGGVESEVVVRRLKARRHDRPYSSSDLDGELSAILLKRRSLELFPVSAINYDLGLHRPRLMSYNDKLRSDGLRRPLSVAEKINNLENFVEAERIETERQRSPSGSSSGVVLKDDVTADTRPSSYGFNLELESNGAAVKGQPVTDEEIIEKPSFFSVSSRATSSCKSVDDGDLDFPELRKPSSGSVAEGKNLTDQLFSRTSFQSSDSDKAWHSVSSHKTECDTDYHSSVDSCGEKISSLSLEDSSGCCLDSMEPKNAEDLMLLKKSGSVTSKTSLFKEIESKMKVEKEEGKTEKVPKANTEVRRRQQKKLLESNAQRFHTQPISSEEVELAVRKKLANTEDNKQDDGGENHEDELSSMSYKDRLRLFETTLASQVPDATLRKRCNRFKTQPVTTEELEVAQSRRLPAVARTSVSDSPPDVNIAETSQNPSPVLTKPKFPRVGEDKPKPKGILKNLNQRKEVTDLVRKGLSSDSESSENEAKNSPRSDVSDSFQSLRKEETETRGILKQGFFEKKMTPTADESFKAKQRTLGANLAAILQKVEPVILEKTRREKKEENGDGRTNRSRRPPKYLQNEGIARLINRSGDSSSLVKSQSHSSVSSAYLSSNTVESEKPFGLNGDVHEEANPRNEVEEVLRVGLKRSTTQPLASSDGSTDDDMSGATIQERLARLKRSGELDWQKRKSHFTNFEDELSAITAGNYLFNENVLLRNPTRSISPQAKEAEESRNSILADRLGRLDAAKEDWKKRIKPSDAVRFSVEGKMLVKMESLSPPNVGLQISPTRTPLAERKKRSPKAFRFRSKQCNTSLSSMPSSPMEKPNNPIARSVSAPGAGKDGLFSLSSPEDSKVLQGPVVTVPRYDDETFTSFFNGISTERILQERLEIKDEDLDVVTEMKSSQLLVQKRNIKIQRRKATVRNPVKALAARLESQEYTEIKTGIAEKELKRMKIEKAAKNSNLAIEALAGLASQEDFTAISLKKASEGGLSSPDAPYKDLMLMQVKGRRHVQTRLIEPTAQNINTGDCFILVTPRRVFHYVGEFANVIERSRGAEISLHIQQKGDLGCNASSVITIGEGGRATEDQVNEFWKLLGGEANCAREAGNLDEDELLESALIDTNMVYEVVGDELVPIEAFWGSIPKIEVLDPNKILVFDFGSEFYVWNGKNVNLAQRKVAMKLARELWEEGYDYVDCDICPLTAASYLGDRRTVWSEIPESEKAGPIRPVWALFAKITQNMETVLFREKFLDWPDYSRVIRRNKENEDNEESDSSAVMEVKPCDAKKMLKNVVSEPDLVLEGNHLGRGISYFDEETRRCSEITTQDVTVWHINEYEYSEVSPKSFGQFHMEDSYVVRWHYVITITGRVLSGQPSKHLTTGRDRYAYFCWQGQDSPISDKGAAACLTVELDKEHGPQVRVVQGFEPPVFLNLFSGRMVVHRGRRCSESSPDENRLFICRGEVETEAVLFEVPSSMRQLRSVASFLLVNRERGKIIVWHGWKSLEHTRKIALQAARHIQNETPEDFGFQTKEVTIREELEGSESQDFVKALGGDNRQLYFSLLDDKTFQVRTPRLFHLSSVSGEFLFAEVASSYLTKETTNPFPFLQSDLYSASQPALFLLDSGSCLWLWQGWWEENSESDRGSGSIRFQAERRAAMMTAMEYWSLKYGNTSPKAYLIWAGLEPLVFTNQFPFWKDRDDIAEINMKEGKKPGEAIPVKTELTSLTQSTYPLSQLQNRPLPEGVNPTSLEDYLEPQCFPELFGLEKEEFFKMPSWKKKKLKQEAGLF